MADQIPLLLYSVIRRELEYSEMDANFQSLKSAVAQFLLAGAAGIYVTGGHIDSNNHVVFTLSNGNTIDFGTIDLSGVTGDFYTKAQTDVSLATLTEEIAAKANPPDNATVLDLLTAPDGKLLFNGQLIQGTGEDPLSFYQTYGYVQIAGAFDSNNNPNLDTQTRINALIVLGIPLDAIFVAVAASGSSPASLAAAYLSSQSTVGTADLLPPNSLGADNAASTSTLDTAAMSAGPVKPSSTISVTFAQSPQSTITVSGFY